MSVYPKAAEHTFFLCAHGIFSRIDHILCHKESIGKFKKIEIISSIFSDSKVMRLKINSMNITVKDKNT